VARAAAVPAGPPAAVAGAGVGSVPFVDSAEPRPAADGRAHAARYANQVHRPAPQSMVIAVLAVVVLLIGAIPAYLILSASSSNPDLSRLDALSLPSWSTSHAVDQTSGNRFCLSSCMKSDRTTQSTRPVNETAAAYTSALRDAGWTPAPANACPPATKGEAQSCWVLDRHQLNVLITRSACAGPSAPPTEPGLADPTGPSATMSVPSGCAPTTVNISIFDRIDIRPAKS
jgi:hypothetical protein